MEDRGAEDNWVVDGVEKGEGGGRMLFHSGDGHKRTMSPTFLRGAANPACPFSRDYSYNDTIFIRMCVACCFRCRLILNDDLSGGGGGVNKSLPSQNVGSELPALPPVPASKYATTPCS